MATVFRTNKYKEVGSIIGGEYNVEIVNQPPGVPRYFCVLCDESYDDVMSHFKSSDHIMKCLVSKLSILKV